MATLVKITDPKQLAGYKENQLLRNPAGHTPGIYVNPANTPQAPQNPAMAQGTYGDLIARAYNDPTYQQAGKQVDAATTELNSLINQTPTFLENKKKDLMAADPALQMLNQERAKFMGNLYSAPITARDQYSNIFDPSKREALIAQAVGNVIGQLSGTNELIGQRKGTAVDLATTAYNALLAQIEGKKNVVSALEKKQSTLGKILEDSAKALYDEQTWQRHNAITNAQQHSGDTRATLEGISSGADYLSTLYDSAADKNAFMGNIDTYLTAIPSQYRIQAFNAFMSTLSNDTSGTDTQTTPANATDPMQGFTRWATDAQKPDNSARIADLRKQINALPVMSNQRIALQKELNSLVGTQTLKKGN